MGRADELAVEVNVVVEAKRFEFWDLGYWNIGELKEN